MAIREIRTNNDEILRKKCRLIEKIDDRVLTLLQDMAETMYEAEGVGLAGPQVGILKRIAVVDVGEGLINLINPEIISFEGTQSDYEGCLSLPNKRGLVTRPFKVKVKALNESGEEFIIEGTELLARALCHEIDHLDGVLFIDHVKDGKLNE